jgi:predicted Zn-dependent protease
LPASGWQIGGAPAIHRVCRFVLTNRAYRFVASAPVSSGGAQQAPARFLPPDEWLGLTDARCVAVVKLADDDRPSYHHREDVQVAAADERALDVSRLRSYAAVLRHLVDAGRFTLAVDLARSTEQPLTEPPPDGEWNYLVAFSLHRAGAGPHEALARYERALAGGFDEFWVRYNRGALYTEMGEVGRAASELTRAVALNPDHGGARAALAQLAGQHTAGRGAGTARP